VWLPATPANQIGLGVLSSPLAPRPLWELTSTVPLGRIVSHSRDSGRLLLLLVVLRLWHSCALPRLVLLVVVVAIWWLPLSAWQSLVRVALACGGGNTLGCDEIVRSRLIKLARVLYCM
jgi:hypothetical protein